MSDVLNKTIDALRKRAAYTRTVREIEEMSLDVALDLDIYRPDAHKIARRAVYGD